MKHATAFFGDVRIPTIGHAKVARVLSSVSARNGPDVVVGVSNAPSPLSEETRNEMMGGVFSGMTIVTVESVEELLSHIAESYNSVSLVCGSDKYDEYQNTLKEHNNTFGFSSWKVLQAGGSRSNARHDPSHLSVNEAIRTASTNTVQSLAESRNWAGFKKCMPRLSERLLRKAYNEIRLNKINESIKHAQLMPMIDSFVEFANQELGFENQPKVCLRKDNSGTSFGGYYPHNSEIHISTKNRHPMDVFRTLAHELVHHKQNEEGRITNPAEEGSDGSDIENEANSIAGVLMRKYGKNNPHHFKLNSIVEAKNKPSDREEGTDSLVTIYSKGTPGQGKGKKKDRHDEGEGQYAGPLNTGIGATFGGSERPYGGYSYSESVEKWMNDPKTTVKYKNRYGIGFAQKIQEDARVIDARLTGLRESMDKGILDMGMVASQGKDDPGFSYDDEPVRILPKLNKKNPKKRKG